MKHDKEAVDRLIQAALEVVADCKLSTNKPYQELIDSVKPFREPQPRVGKMLVAYRPCPENAQEVNAIELTEAVRTRLGPSAGVDRDDVATIIKSVASYRTLNLAEKVEAIMALIAEGQVEAGE